jgi:hypothetical protein
MRALLGLAAVFLLSACGASLKDGIFVKDEVRYRVRGPDETTWKRIDFADNDLAWASVTSGQVLAVNATCRGHEDPPLEVLTTHLLFGFSARERVSQRLLTLDGREALRSHYRARLDGVPVEIELVVLKKNGCVHDFTAVSPAGQQALGLPAFEALLAESAEDQELRRKLALGLPGRVR